MPSLPTRIVVDRFGDTEIRHTGPEARRLRRAIKAEQEAALAHGDATGDYSRLRAIANTEAEIARRAERNDAA